MVDERGIPLPTSFEEQVVEALRRLYEPAALARSPLADVLLPASTDLARGRRLRELLVEAVETLNPGPNIPFRSTASRSYDAIRMRYVEGLTVEVIAKELAVSERQAYRDVGKGETEVAAWLWSRRPGSGHASQEADAGPISREISRLRQSPSETNLLLAAEAARTAVASLAGRAQVTVELGPSLDVTVPVDAATLRQCLTAAMSYGIQAGAHGLTVGACPAADSVELWLRWPAPEAGDLAPKALLATVRSLAKALGADLSVERAATSVELALRLPARRPDTILVIDDNEGLRELFERYLADSDWRPVGAAGPDEGLRLAGDLAPSAIVLDILMPGVDGWAVLSALKSDPRTSAIPVVVCSVFNDPELAFSLGAVGFVAKPVTRAKLLQALKLLRR
ncbi:MAG: response regulator [Anaerolineae bacterium]